MYFLNQYWVSNSQTILYKVVFLYHFQIVSLKISHKMSNFMFLMTIENEQIWETSNLHMYCPWIKEILLFFPRCFHTYCCRSQRNILDSISFTLHFEPRGGGVQYPPPAWPSDKVTVHPEMVSEWRRRWRRFRGQCTCYYSERDSFGSGRCGARQQQYQELVKAGRWGGTRKETEYKSGLWVGSKHLIWTLNYSHGKLP